MATSTSVISAVADSTGEVEPAERRMFQLTDLQDNHNKFYFVELWPVNDYADTVRFRASWGRVGAKAQACEKVVSWREVERQIAEKVRKGYRPVDLHRPPVELVDVGAANDADGEMGKAVVRLDPRVAQLVDWV